MLRKLLLNKIKIVQLLFLVGLFAIIRAFENQLFYDPFLNYFKSENLSIYPEFDSVKLYFSLFFRYFLNSVISLAILYVLFRDYSLLKFSAFLLLIFLILLLILFVILLNYFDESQNMILFYVRRFIIQPIFILLFIPGFYFQKITNQ
jgi:exosortase F-associated protein